MKARSLLFLFLSALLVNTTLIPSTSAGTLSQVTKSVSKRAFAPQTTRTSVLAANRLAGAAAERRAADNLIANGHRIIGRQVSVRTPRGRRVIDYLICSPRGRVVAIEVKSGHAIRGPQQVAKDRAMASRGGILVGRNAPTDLRGKRMILKTAERRH